MANNTRRTLITHALLLGCIMVISACTAIPVQEREDIPERFPERFAASGPDGSAGRLCWRQSFPSEHLRADVEALLGGNFELEAARARVAQAAAAHGLSEAELMPALNAGVNFDHSEVKEVEKDAVTTTRNLLSFEAGLQWELDIWGRLRAREKAASFSLAEQRALADGTKLDLQTSLVENWVTHHAARKLEQVLAKQRETNAQFLSLTELRFAQGQGNALDVLQQRGRLASTERELPAVTSRKRRTANAYAVLMGRLPEYPDLPKEELPAIERLTVLPRPCELLDDRPDLRAAFLALRAADHEVAAAVADRLPRLSAGLSYGESFDVFSTMGKGTALHLTTGLLAPVFDAGRLKAKAAERKAEARELLALLEQAMLAAIREVEDALIRENALLDEQTLLRGKIAIARDQVEKARLRYVHGRESYLAVLLALEELQSLQVDEITLQQELLINRCHLLRALGAEWDHQHEIS